MTKHYINQFSKPNSNQKMANGSRVQVMNGNADKTTSGMTKNDIKLNPKTGRYVSKAKSAQAMKKMAGNKRMQLRKQATKEVTKGREDVRDLFKAGDTPIKRDVRKRYEELLQMNNLPVTTSKQSKTVKKRATTVSKKSLPTKSNRKKPSRSRGGGWFY